MSSSEGEQFNMDVSESESGYSEPTVKKVGWLLFCFIQCFSRLSSGIHESEDGTKTRQKQGAGFKG